MFSAKLTSITQDIFDGIPGYLFSKDCNSIYLTSNRAISQIAGFTSLEGQSDFNLPWEKYAASIAQMDKRVFQGESLTYVEPIVLIDKKDYTLLTRKNPLKDKSDKIIGLVGYSTVLPNSKALKNTKIIRQCDIEQFGILPTHYDIKSIFPKLTKKESICLFYYIRGKTVREIAELIYLSPRTIESHIKSIKNKLHCKNKSDLIETAFKNGYVYIIPEEIFKS